MGIVLNWNSTYPGGGIDNTTINFPPVSDGIHDVLATHVNALANAVINLETAVGALGGLGVREVDSSPNIRPVHTLVFPNGSLTDLGSNTVQVTVSGGESGGTSRETISQTAHGFTLTNAIPLPVYWNGISWLRADVSDETKTKQAFIVEIVNANSFVVQLQGWHDLTLGHGLVDGNYYWSISSAPYYSLVAPTSGISHCLWMVVEDTLQLLNQAPYVTSDTEYIQVMDPIPDEDTLLVADGSGGLKSTPYITVDTTTGDLSCAGDGDFGGDLQVAGTANFDSAVTMLSTLTVTGLSVLDSIAPLVQSTHTSATRSLAIGDLNNIIPLSAAANAIAVTIPSSLFAAAGTGRAFTCSLRVLSVSGGAVTFVGSGGIVITYHGKDPGTLAIAAGDSIHVVVTSATSADVYISAVAT